MSALHLLRKLGVYTQENFLTPAECAEIRASMDKAKKVQAGVASDQQPQSSQDNKLRQTLYAQIPKTLHKTVLDRTLALKPDLEKHFGERYAQQFESPKYLQYLSGHFFAPHTDDQMNRRLNISIYLNNQINEPQKKGLKPSHAEYSGGELRLFGLFPSSAWENRGIVVPGIAGLLVAYPADTVHEVTPIISGNRYAIVSRFLSDHIDHQQCVD